MSLGLIVLMTLLTTLLIGWLMMAFREPPLTRRVSADYRRQHTENPDWLPGHAGGASGA